jgi:hypothetical protein
MANYFVKKPIPVLCQQATADGTITTLEGVMSYEAGDWIIIGITGERYPCKREVFEASYEECPSPEVQEPSQYLAVMNDAQAEVDRLKDEIEASKWLDEDAIPKALKAVCDERDQLRAALEQVARDAASTVYWFSRLVPPKTGADRHAEMDENLTRLDEMQGGEG